MLVSMNVFRVWLFFGWSVVGQCDVCGCVSCWVWVHWGWFGEWGLFRELGRLKNEHDDELVNELSRSIIDRNRPHNASWDEVPHQYYYHIMNNDSKLIIILLLE